MSICIPTYNREELLKKNLENIVFQAKKFNIPIYVSDNNSSDKTKEMVENIKKKYEYVFYQKNTKNLGFDKNILKLIEMSKTDYCWIFGDDDFLENNAIEIVYNKICEINPSLIVVNASVYNKTFSSLLEEKRLKIDEDKIYTNLERDKALIDLADYVTYVGAIVIKRNEWNKIEIKNLKECEDFVHITKVFNYIKNDANPIYVIESPLIKIRYGNATWSTRSFKIWNFNWPNTIYKTLNYNKITKNKLIQEITIKTLLKKSILDRAKGNYNIEGYKLIKENIKLNIFYKILFFLISKVSIKILNRLIVLSIKLFKKKVSPILLYDLDIKIR